MSIADYERPSLTTDVVLFRVADVEVASRRRYADKQLQILLVKRDDEPSKGFWSLPGGFVNIDEDIFANAKRKLMEKTGVHGDFYMEQLYTWGELGRDSRGRVISVSYLGLCNEETYIEDSVNRETEWFNVEDILSGKFGELAFDHAKIIQFALTRMENKIEYTDIAFNLLPEYFTLRECQTVYELILNKEVNNFRRKISSYVDETDKVFSGMQFNPAKLYTRKTVAESRF